MSSKGKRLAGCEGTGLTVAVGLRVLKGVGVTVGVIEGRGVMVLAGVVVKVAVGVRVMVGVNVSGKASVAFFALLQDARLAMQMARSRVINVSVRERPILDPG